MNACFQCGPGGIQLFYLCYFFFRCFLPSDLGHLVTGLRHQNAENDADAKSTKSQES